MPHREGSSTTLIVCCRSRVVSVSSSPLERALAILYPLRLRSPSPCARRIPPACALTPAPDALQRAAPGNDERSLQFKHKRNVTTHIHTLPGKEDRVPVRVQVADRIADLRDRREARPRAVRDKHPAVRGIDELGRRATLKHVHDLSALHGTLERK